MGRRSLPLRSRRVDLVFIAFFLINICFVTYIADIEQLVIGNPYHFVYPFWPPPAMVNMVHWWGRTFDPLLMARPVWWKMTIWIDVLGFGPFYAVATYAERATTRPAPGTLPPAAVARAALDALGRGPRVVPGPFNQVAAALMARLLPRRTAIGIMAGQTGNLARG